MIKLTVLYPNTPDLKFDKEYYVNKHGQLLTDLLDAIISSDVNMGLVVLLYTGALCRNCKHGFESMESFEHSLAQMPKRLWPIFQISRMFSHKFKLVSFYK
jgi:hypothetical protein